MNPLWQENIAADEERIQEEDTHKDIDMILKFKLLLRGKINQNSKRNKKECRTNHLFEQN